jgi:bifunctional DNA-binding transcriptional regulator/antitoxin component of YhaV-PrlF toxin-antitoxin module
MAERKAMDAVLRPKRQLTLPRRVCEQLGISTGDVLELSLEGDTLVARPRKKAALEALGEIRQAFQRSGITEEELQKAGRRARQEVTRERDSARA